MLTHHQIITQQNIGIEDQTTAVIYNNDTEESSCIENGLNNCLDFKISITRIHGAKFFNFLNSFEKYSKSNCKQELYLFNRLTFVCTCLFNLAVELYFIISILPTNILLGVTFLIIDPLIILCPCFLTCFRIINHFKNLGIKITHKHYYLMALIVYTIFLFGMIVLSKIYFNNLIKMILEIIGAFLQLFFFKLFFSLEIILKILFGLLISFEYILKSFLFIIIFPYSIALIFFKIVEDRLIQSRNNSRNLITADQIKKLPVMEFNKLECKAVSCIVCLNSFEENEKIVQLNCHETHIFH